MKLPLISIIVPIYQVEKYLRSCLDSICAQTYKNLEILLIDDGSTDRSGEICEEYAKNDQRIVVIHQENKGLSAARNKGIEISSGDYLTFVDPDDLLLHDRYIELMLEALLRDKAQISICGQITFGGIAQPEYWIEYEKSRTAAGRDILDQKSGVPESYSWNVLSKLFERSIFSDLRFPEGHLLEDTAIIHRIFLPVKTVSILGIRMYGKLIRQSSILGSIDPEKKFRESMFAFNDRASYYREMNDAELEERALFEKTASKAIYYLHCEKNNMLDVLIDIPAEDRPSLHDLKELFSYYFPRRQNKKPVEGRKRIVLHIGQTKTGTTAIQAFLRKNYKLLEAQGICFYQPVEFAVERFRNAWFTTFSILKEQESFSDELLYSKLMLEKWLFGEYAKCFHAILMSDEAGWTSGIKNNHFWSALRRYYESIFGEDIDFKIIISLRRQDDWLYSNWKEHIRMLGIPERRDFRTYLRDMQNDNMIDYHYGLSLIREAFGKDNIIVIPYAANVKENGIVDSFCDLAGVTTDESFVFPSSRINSSITGENALAMLAINQRVVSCNVDRKKIKRAAGLLSDLYPETERHYPLPREERDQLLDYYREGNRAVAREYIGCDELFDYEIGDYKVLTPDRDRDIEKAKKLIEFAAILPAQDGFKRNDK